ncbi:MAG: hypothetical protein ACXWFG_15970 [Methylobacter sp.]
MKNNLRYFESLGLFTRVSCKPAVLIGVQILPVPFKKQHPYLPAKSFILLFL